MELNPPSIAPDLKHALEALWSSLARRVYSSTDDIKCLTNDEQLVFAVMLFRYEVYNGGIEQFYSNSSGAYYKETQAGLEVLGANQTRGLLLLATRLIFAGEVPPTNRNQRHAALASPQIEAWSDALEVLDSAIDSSTDNVLAKLAAFATEKGLIPAGSIVSR